MVTYKNFKEQVNDALSSYRKEYEIDKRDPEVIFIDAYTAAFNLDKMPSRDAVKEILTAAMGHINYPPTFIDDCLERVEKHFGL